MDASLLVVEYHVHWCLRWLYLAEHCKPNPKFECSNLYKLGSFAVGNVYPVLGYAATSFNFSQF